jgi:hypothetical protein
MKKDPIIQECVLIEDTVHVVFARLSGNAGDFTSNPASE